MIPARRAVLIGALFLALVPRAASGAQDRPDAGAGPHPLKMEELEVRGLREKPDRLYLPVPGQVHFPLPTRFDLFREDLARPVLPWEIVNDGTTNGEESDAGDSTD